MKHIVIIGRKEQEWAADPRIQSMRSQCESRPILDERQSEARRSEARQSREADANVHRRRVKGPVFEPAASFFFSFAGLQWSEKQRNLISSPERFTFSPLFTASF